MENIPFANKAGTVDEAPENILVANVAGTVGKSTIASIQIAPRFDCDEIYDDWLAYVLDAREEGKKHGHRSWCVELRIVRQKNRPRRQHLPDRLPRCGYRHAGTIPGGCSRDHSNVLQ